MEWPFWKSGEQTIKLKNKEKMEQSKGLKRTFRGFVNSLDSLRGFTILEFLVVMVIAGLFSVVVLPALLAGGENERAASCMNNLRQIGQIIEMYKVDNDFWIPANSASPYGHGGHVGWTWREAIWHYIEPGYGIPTPHGAFPTDTPRIYNCPSDTGGMQRDRLQCSYNMNSHRYRRGGEDYYDGIGRSGGEKDLPFIGSGTYWTHDSWVEDPSGTILALDGKTPYWSWRYNDTVRGPADLLPPGREMNPEGPKHEGGYNFLFCDGSARWYKLEDTVGTGKYDLDNHSALGMWTKTNGN